MRTLLTAIMVICLAPLAHAEEAAGKLEQQIMGYWAPDKEAMLKAFADQKGIKGEDAAEMVDEMSMVFEVEAGQVKVYSNQGRMTVPYEVLSTDEKAQILEVRAKGQQGAPKPQSMKLKVEEAKITVTGDRMPFVLKKVDQKEFTKLIEGLPTQSVGP